MIFRQFARITGCVRNVMLAQKYGPRISEFCSKFTFLLEQETKSVLNCDSPYFPLLADLMAKTLKQTEDRVAEVKRRAEDAVSDVKRQAVIELQKAVCAAEEKANEALTQAHQRMEKAVMEARRQATEETITVVNRQESSREVIIMVKYTIFTKKLS